MRARVHFGRGVLVSSLLAGFAAGASFAQAPGVIGAIDPHALHLRAGTIHLDAATSIHRARDGAAVAPLAQAGRFVVQLDGPLTPEKRDALAAIGVTLGQYLPANAYVVRLPAGFDSGKFSNTPFVRWVGPFDKMWKLDPTIGQRTFQTPERLALQQQNIVKLTVQLFAGEDVNAGLAALLALPGAVITAADFDGSAGIFEMTLPAGTHAALADIPAVQFIEEASEAVLRNSTNRWILQTNVSSSTTVWNKGLHGENQVGGHIDGGVRTDHCSFADPLGVPIGSTHRKIVAYFGSTAVDPHGTHTAGTFLGDEQPVSGGTTNRGMAYMARMAFTNLSSVGSSNLLTILNQNRNANGGNGGRVHSNSWGDDGTTSYTSWCRAIDVFSFNNEDNLVLFACTNLNAAVKTPENAKNCLAVVLTSDSPNQGSQCSSVGFAMTQDGRRKPEVTAPGCSTVSSNSGTTCGFTGSGFTGNSMACPAVAGCGLLVRQYFTDGFYPSGAAVSGNAFTPSGALMKAMLINSAVDMTGISGYPSNREGWGRVLLENALYFAGDTRMLVVLDDKWNANGLSTGQSANYNVTVTGSSEPLKVTLVWTEEAAAVNANPAYINNLNLTVTAPGPATYLGNVFSGGQSATGGSADLVNNVEQVLLNAPSPGSYTITVNAPVVNTTGLKQGYALLVTGQVASVLPAPTISSITPNTGETDSIVNVTNLAGGNFQSGATVRLTKSGQPDINATAVNVVNAGQITCSLNLAGAVIGPWNVVVTNPDTQAATLANGFLVTVTCSPGDMDDNGTVDGADIGKFVAATLNGTGTQRELCAADINGDTFRNSTDTGLFITCLLQGVCP
ncbi:MAG: S8 family serine peptidase [Phycisphaerae bacterium]|nr:S8 family serine peptidase [Phycisphaerae bacterium]